MAYDDLADYLIFADQFYSDVEKGERWYVDCAIPIEEWSTAGVTSGAQSTTLTAAAPGPFVAAMVGSTVKFTATGNTYLISGYTSATVVTVTLTAVAEGAGAAFTVEYGWSIVPDKGDAPPAAPNAFPSRLGIVGTCLRRSVLFPGAPGGRPGWAIVKLTYGWDPAQVADNSSYITMRTILVEESLNWSLDDPPNQMTGRKYIADKPTRRVYGVKGATERNIIPYQIIRIYALLDGTGRTLYAKPLVHKAVNVNDDSWTFGGMTFGANTLMFRGVTLDYSRRLGQSDDHRIYNAVFEFIERPGGWPLIVTCYEWEEVVKQVDIYNVAGTAVIGQTKVGALAPISDTGVACIIRAAYAFDDVLGSTAAPLLIS